MLKFQNAKGPYTSVSIFSSNEIVSPSVLHKMRYFQGYLLTLITHTPLQKKYLMSPRHSVCPKISRSSGQRLNSSGSNIACLKLMLTFKCNNLTQQHSPCRKVAMFGSAQKTNKLYLPKHGRPLSRCSPPSRVYNRLSDCH